jgi:hypothetical protein
VKAYLLVAIASAAAAPIAIQSGMDSLDPAELGQDGDLWEKAAQIAEERFAGAANLSVLEVKVTDERIGVFGERIRPDPGFAYHVALVRVENVGKMDLAISYHHFSGLDDAKSDHWIEMGGAHDDFQGARLGKGQSRNGEVTFELRKGSWLTEIVWQGDLANATAPVPNYEHP